MTFFFIILWETHRHPTSISGIDPFPLLLWSDHTTYRIVRASLRALYGAGRHRRPGRICRMYHGHYHGRRRAPAGAQNTSQTPENYI